MRIKKKICYTHISLKFQFLNYSILCIHISYPIHISLFAVIFSLLTSAFEELPALHRALRDLVSAVDATYAKTHEELFVGFKGSFGSKHVSPRTLCARNLGNLVCVEGIVTKCKSVNIYYFQN